MSAAELWDVVVETYRDAVRPEPDLKVSEWAEAYRVLDQSTSAEPGPWRTARTPYLREIMDSLSPSDPCEEVVFQKGTQVGGTEGGNNWTGFVIHHAPGPMMYVQPTVETAKAYSKTRIAPMIEKVPVLGERIRPARSRDSGNTLFQKDFPGGFLRITGANSAVGLRSLPIRYLFLDEVDGYPDDVDGEGDPVELARKRTDTFARNRKILIVSTPTVKGLSRIERAMDHSDQRRYFVPCPSCRAEQPITWGKLRWDRADDGEHLPATVRMICEACEAEIPETRKDWMLARGKWVATAKGNGRTRGYHLSALYSPLGWFSWTEAVEAFLSAKKEGVESLKTWTNTVLAETWEEKGETVEPESLFSRREAYEADVPEGVLVLTAGVDVQDDRLELEVVGWGLGKESWSIDYAVLYGDPETSDVWDRLDDQLRRPFFDAEGQAFTIKAAGVDSGNWTDIVYRFCAPRESRMIYAMKGEAGPGKPIARPAKRKHGKKRRPVNLFLLGVDEAKTLLYAQLRQDRPGAGYCHFPIAEEYDRDHFDQLTAEKRVLRYVKGHPRPEWILPGGKRNEALDCRVLAMGALELLDPVFEVVQKRLARRRDRAAAPPQAEDLRRAAAGASSVRERRRQGGFVNRWKR